MPAQAVHQDVMIYTIKEALQINIYSNPLTRLHIGLGFYTNYIKYVI